MMWGDRVNSVTVPGKEVLWWWCDGFGCTKTEVDCFFNLELAPSRAQRVLISNLKYYKSRFRAEASEARATPVSSAKARSRISEQWADSLNSPSGVVMGIPSMRGSFRIILRKHS